MKRYQAALRRVPCGIAAVAMAAITFGLLVVAPATIESDRQAIRMPPASQAVAMRPADGSTAADQHAAAEIQPAVACDKANRSLTETRCPQTAHQPTKSDSRGIGCLDVS